MVITKKPLHRAGAVARAWPPLTSQNRTSRHRVPSAGACGHSRSNLVSRFRSSHHYAARSLANFGIKGTLAIYDSSAVFGFEVPTQARGYNDRNFQIHRTKAVPGGIESMGFPRV